MTTKRIYLMGWVALLATAAGTSPSAVADPIQLQAYTGVVAGANECSGGAPPAALSFFSTNVGFGVGNSGNGISGCGLAGSINNVVNPGVGAPQAVSATNLNNAGYLGGTGLYSGSGNATASFSGLTVSANGALTGSEPANGVAESVAAAFADDTINIAGSGNGYVQFQYTINGGLSQSANDIATGAVEVEVQLGSDPDRAFYANVSEGSSGIFGLFGDPVRGCTTGTGSFNCVNGVFSTAMLPIMFGTNTAYDVGLIVGTELLGGPGSIDPLPGMTLTGIEVLNADGTPISDFSITSGSGAVYGAGGFLSEPTTATPEPAMPWLGAGGMLVLIVAARLRHVRGTERRAK